MRLWQPLWIWPASIAALCLAAAAAFVPTFQASGVGQTETFRTDVDAVVGQRVLASHFPAGSGSPAVIIARPDELTDGMRIYCDCVRLGPGAWLGAVAFGPDAYSRFEQVIVCHGVREDGAFIEAGENDNLIVRKLGESPNMLGIFGFSFLDQNADAVNADAAHNENAKSELVARVAQLLVENADRIESKRPKAKRNNCGYHLWDVLMFQAWLAEQK